MRLSVFLLSAAAISTPLQAAEEVLFGPVPDWVEEPTIMPGEDANSEIPVRVVNLDTQMLLNPDSQTVFTAVQLKFQSPQGLSAGNISLPWRSETDELTFHRLQILREDEVIDVLASGQTFTVLRREQNLEQAMLTGVLTANMFPEGLEVGDVLDLAYSIESRHPVLKGHAEAFFGPFNSPADNVTLQILWPTSSNINLGATKDLPEWERGRRDGLRTAGFSLKDIEPIRFPEGAPTRFAVARFAEASDYSTWGEVANLFVPLYREASVIPTSGPLRNEVERIRSATADAVERAELALALVQDRVRYVALAMGAAGYVPSDAETTWSRRFGDCKAKTALLIGILAELDIEAEPVAVHSLLGDMLPTRLPSVSAFDHIIVRANVAGTTYFLDGTSTGDKALERLTVPNYSWGLPIVAGDAQLIPMVPGPLALPVEDTTIRMDATAGIYAPVPTRMERILRGDLAKITLAWLNQLVGDGQRKALEEYWTDEFDFVTPLEVSFSQDQETGDLKLELDGTSELEWEGVWLQASDMRLGFNADYSRDDGPDSDAPFAIGHPFYNRMTQIISLPPGFKTEEVLGDAIDETIASREYKRSVELKDDVFTATRSWRSLAGEFPFSEAEDAERRLTDLYMKRLHLRKPDDYKMSAADIAAAESSASADVDTLIEMVVDLMDAGEYDRSLKLLDRVNELDPANAWGWANRAVVLANKSDVEGALAAAAKAEALAPDNYVVWHARALSAERQGDKEAAIAAYSKAIELSKDDVWAIARRGAIYYSSGRFDESIADSRRIFELNPDDFGNTLTEANALLALGRKVESEALTDQMAERFLDNPEALVAIGIMYQQLGLDDKRAALTEAMMKAGPSAAALTALARERGASEKKLAIADLTKALEIDPDYVPALIARADLYWLDYQNDLAIADADAAIARSPTSFQAYNTKAEVMIDMDRPAGAARVADDLAAALPDNPVALSTAAQIYMRVEYKTKAREMADRIVAKLPDDALALAMAAQTYSQIQDMKKAREAIQRAHEIAPEHPMVKPIYSFLIEGKSPFEME